MIHMMKITTILVCLFLFPSIALSYPQYPALFGSKEKSATHFRLFPQWKKVLKRYEKEKNTAENQRYKQWKVFLNSIRNKSRGEQVRLVNKYVNKGKYVIDAVNWRVTDYWETPKQFYTVFGDCEDFAITKFMSLRLLGFSQDQLRIVILRDLNLAIDHAVLAVYIGGSPYILDNQIPNAVRASSIRHYRPIYSLNERRWWKHYPKKRS